MMIRLFKGWWKIYLFYGVLFFLLGFSGYLATDNLRLVDWFFKQIKKSSYFLAEKFWRPNINQAITVFSRPEDEVVFFIYSYSETNDLVDYQVKQIQDKLQANFLKVFIKPITNFNELDIQLDKLTIQKIPWILVGFHSGKAATAYFGNNAPARLFFSLSGSSLNSVSSKLFQTLTSKFTTITVHKYLLKHGSVIEFDWQGTANANFLSDVVGILLENIDLGSLKKFAGKTLD